MADVGEYAYAGGTVALILVAAGGFTTDGRFLFASEGERLLAWLVLPRALRRELPRARIHRAGA